VLDTTLSPVRAALRIKVPATSRVLAIAAAACISVGVAHAGNGLNVIGFGAESIGMGGADIAVARDTTALNTNPAGIARLRRMSFDGYSAIAYALDVAHADRFGNNYQVDNNIIGVGGFGFSKPLGSSDLVAGIGFFVQGGAGNVYKHLETPFGGRDELSALFGIVRINPGLAWRATDRLSLGASLAVTHALAQQHIFPSVSVVNPVDPTRNFFGAVIKDLQTTKVGARFGVQYEIAPGVTLAGVYGTKTGLPLNKGHADINLRALGLGTVRYHDVSVVGLGLPREIGVGVAWQATRQTLLSLEVTQLAWSHVLRSQTLTISNPNNPAAPAIIQQTSRLDWKDQYVIAAGTAHDLTEKTTLYAGFNYGRNPIPAQTTSPLLSATGEKHMTAGVRMRLDGGWQISGALEYLFSKKVTYNNPELLFGPGAQERNEYIAFTLMLGKRW
jgi:long-chain fatty acid transport protein